MDLKKELYYGLREIRDEVGGEIGVEYLNGEIKGSVKAIVYNTDIQQYNNTTPVYSQKLIVNILKEDLIEQGLPIKRFSKVRWNRVEYIPKQRPYSNWEQVIVLECDIVGRE